MPRQPRKSGEYLHLIVRGIAKQILFEDDADREKYISFLQKYTDELKIDILAYCMMENHVHLLVYDSHESVSVFMKKVGICYAQYYNHKYQRTGHLFQDRFKSEIIRDERQLLIVYRYILKNPEKAGICRAEVYHWSSYHEYNVENGLTKTEVLVGMIGNGKDFQQFMLQMDDNECMEDERKKKDDSWALETIRNTLGVKSGTQLQQFDRAHRDAALAILKMKGISIRQLERLTGINRGIIQKAKGVNENRPR